MKQFTSETQRTGRKGEIIARNYLVHKGFEIIEQNYTKKMGEIDIVAKLGLILHFIEVKTIISGEAVTRETYSPFENVSRVKLRKFSRTCECYLAERGVTRETKWQIDVIAVTVTPETRSAKVEALWNVIA